MIQISDAQFDDMVGQAIAAIPSKYQQRLENVAFLIEAEPSPQQRVRLSLHPGETLFGLYEGVPLPQRGGVTKLLPDKITVFKNPLLAASQNTDELKQRLANTIWHEVAHYFGLDHGRIHKLENKG